MKKHNMRLSREVLVDLLQTRSPELGARLKHRLRNEYLRRGVTAFDERDLGFSKFTDFLDANSDIVLVDRSAGPGDVSVFLIRPKQAVERRTSRLRNEIWQAFTNPDVGKTHLFDRRTTQLRPKMALGEAPDSALVEFEFIPGEQQLIWMRQFLEESKLDSGERKPLELLLTGPYRSRLNIAFTSALGNHGADWRRKRTSLIAEWIQAWANRNNVDYQQLVDETTNVPVAHPRPPSSQELSTRHRIDTLLDLIPENKLRTFIVPILLAAVWESGNDSGM